MSALRLAAEAAFAAPPFVAPAARAAVVTVRKARVVVQAHECAAMDEAPSGLAAAGKHSRVFRVEAARPMRPMPAPVDALHAQWAAASARTDMAAAMPPELSHSRRDPNRRPGPVRHVIPGLPALADGEAPRADLDGLATQLAGVEPVFDAIRHARAFTFLDPRTAGEWQRLSLLAESLRHEITASLR